MNVMLVAVRERTRELERLSNVVGKAGNSQDRLLMFLMLAEVMRLWTLKAVFPASRFWAFVAYNTTHVPWQGCSLHDLIQPGFSFLAGASLPFSIASRKNRGESFARI